ncbi:MAG TPA: hypothetical protein VMS37_28550 [Verrucomicrobiae bacterium]|nr:hypothetical protein [Verrucomicrobiae bacterium]
MRRPSRVPVKKQDEVPGPRRRWPAIRPDWIVAFLLLVVLSAVVTDGDWDFFPHAKSYEEYYDGQAQSLLHGKIDVPLQSILAERFVRNGKFYGYFGPTPALLRIPLNLLMPGMYGRWSHASMLLGSLFGMAMLILLFRRLEDYLQLRGTLWAGLRAMLLVSVFLGSTNVFLSTESMVYQESIMWASALTLAHAVFLVSYLIQPKIKWLVLSCVLAFLAFNAKISSGAGPLVALSILDAALLIPYGRIREYWGALHVPAPRRKVSLITATLAISVASWGGLNYWKFGVVFTSQPLLLTPHPDPERLRRIKGSPFSFANIPLTLSIYLKPTNIRFRPYFPWAFLLPADPRLAAGFPNSHFDGIEPVASVTATMPVLFLGAVAGMGLCFLTRRKELRVFRAALIGTLAGTFLVLTWGTITQRFLHDALPWLALGTTIAVAHIPLAPGKWARFAATGLLLIGTIYAVWVNLAFAALHKRVDTLQPDADTKRVAFADLSQNITSRGVGGALDYLTHWRKYVPAVEFQQGNVTSGNTVFTDRIDVSLIWYDGKPPGIADYSFDFPDNGTYEISLLYASPDPRPLRLLVNGVQVLQGVCGVPTGGPFLNNERWCKLGAFRVPAGSSSFTLVSDGKFPIVRMFRFVKVG